MKRVCVGIGFHRVPAVAVNAEYRSKSVLNNIPDESVPPPSSQSEMDLPPHKRIRMRLRQSKLQQQKQPQSLPANPSSVINFIPDIPMEQVEFTKLPSSSLPSMNVSRSPSPKMKPLTETLVSETPVQQQRRSPLLPPSTIKSVVSTRSDKRLSYTGTAQMILDTLDHHISKPGAVSLLYHA
jgi:hypothetical protein